MFTTPMPFHVKKRPIWALFFFALLVSLDASAQWTEFKEGLRDEVQVAVESDSMLVVHHNGISFSFIVTTKKSSSSDIYPTTVLSDAAASDIIWQTTERFWSRLHQGGHSIESIFRPDFLDHLQHPEGAQESQTENELSEDIASKPPKTLAERIVEAKDRGDFEVASLLALMAQPKNADTSTSAAAVSADLQNRLQREKAVLEKMYEHGRQYEANADWSMAIAVYENLLVLGEFKDARSRLNALLATQKQYTDSLKIVRRQEDARMAMQTVGGTAGNETALLDEFQTKSTNGYTTLDVVRSLAPGSGDNSRTIDPAEPALTDSSQVLAGLYEQALFYIQHENWQGAHTTLHMLGLKETGYRDSRQLMQMVENRLATEKNAAKILAAVLVGLALVLLAGSVVMSKSLRAQVWALMGMHKKAETIYELQLAQNPGRIKLYGKLAESYLKTKRRDEQPMKVFEMVRKLNLKIKHRQAVDRMVRISRPY